MSLSQLILAVWVFLLSLPVLFDGFSISPKFVAVFGLAFVAVVIYEGLKGAVVIWKEKK